MSVVGDHVVAVVCDDMFVTVVGIVVQQHFKEPLRSQCPTMIVVAGLKFFECLQDPVGLARAAAPNR